MGNVKYTIVSGNGPFVAKLTPSLIPENIHNNVGTYEFLDVPNGTYIISVTDSNDCVFQQEIIVNPLIATTTTTLAPESSIVVGNTQDESLIFNINATNRDTHYDGYPNPNTSNLFLWLKTLNGAPLTIEKVINYSFSSNGASTFMFNALSDEIHTNIIQNNIGPSPIISGQLYLKTGFIETYFHYTYQKDIINPNYQIDLNSNMEWLYVNIPTITGINIYGVTYIDRDNIIMKF